MTPNDSSTNRDVAPSEALHDARRLADTEPADGSVGADSGWPTPDGHDTDLVHRPRCDAADLAGDLERLPLGLRRYRHLSWPGADRLCRLGPAARLQPLPPCAALAGLAL